MLAHHSKRKLFFGLLSILFFGTALKANAGLDSYSIYLNDKLILKQYVNQPLTLESLGLNQSNINDRLIIHYEQCNAPNKLGKSRSITVKDNKGNLIKKWNFKDAQGGNTGMVIAVRDLLQLEKSTPLSKLSLFYTAEGHGGQLLANFHFEKERTAFKEAMPFEAKESPYFSFPYLLLL